jgi:hypothetical protein
LSVGAAEPLFLDDSTRAAVAAVQAVSAGHPLSAACLVVAGKDRSLWENLPEPPPPRSAAADRAPVLDADLLASVVDHTKIPSWQENREEALAFEHTFMVAHQTPLKALAKSARRDLTLAHLKEEPAKNRGQVVHLEGLLRRLRRFDPSTYAARQGIKDHYEGWIYTDTSFTNPYCVVVSEIGSGIPVADKIEDCPVSVDGYFFKRYRYQAGDKLHEAPLLIGRSITQPKTTVAPPAESSTGEMLIQVFLGLLAVTAVLAIGLAVWFRHSDKRILDRIRQARTADFPEPGVSGHSEILDQRD